MTLLTPFLPQPAFGAGFKLKDRLAKRRAATLQPQEQASKDAFTPSSTEAPLTTSYYYDDHSRWLSRKNKVRMFVGAALLATGWGTYAMFKDDGAPTLANFYTAAGEPGNCRLSQKLNVICNGIRRGSVDERGRAYNIFWEVGRVGQDGALWFDVYNGPTVQVGRVDPEGKVYGVDNRYYGRIDRSTELWDAAAVPPEAKGAAAILALRPDANDGPKQIIAEIVFQLLRALAESESQPDD